MKVIQTRQRTNQQLTIPGSLDQKSTRQASLTPYYKSTDSSIVLYHGDAREILPQLKAESANLCLTDPPYGQDYISPRRAKNDPLRQPIAGDKDQSLLRQVAPLIDRVMADGSHLYFFAAADASLAGETAQIIRDHWKLKNTLIWAKGRSGTIGDVVAGYGVNFEHIIYANKGRRRLIGSRPRCILDFPWTGSRDPVHPNVKPVSLLETIIKSSSLEDDLILDCFAGSGTVLRAAKNLGRRAIGIELDKDFCDRAIDRLGGK